MESQNSNDRPDAQTAEWPCTGMHEKRGCVAW